MTVKRSSRRHSGRPTIGDVAKLANCSSMTVSRVINGEQSVRESTRQAVLAAVEELNYSPNRAARSLAGGTQIRVALLYLNPSAAYLSEFLMGGMDQASLSGVPLVVERCPTIEEAEGVVKRLSDSGISGFLLPSPLCDDQKLLDQLRKLPTRIILVGPGRAEPHYSAVMIDEYQAAFDMTQHILGLGHTRIGFIVGNPKQVASSQRLAGYLDALSEAGIEQDDTLIAQGQYTYRSGLDAASKLLGQQDRPTAIFASNDDMAAATVAAALSRNISVPADLTVTGFDDTSIASTIWPELTTIRQPISEMSRRAVSQLVSELRAESSGQSVKPNHITLDYELIIRDSDAAPGLVSQMKRKKT